MADNRTSYQNRSQQNGEIQIDATEYTTRLELLYEVAQKATSYSEVLKLIENILSITKRIMQASSVSLFVIDNGKGVLYYLLVDGKGENGLGQTNLDVDSGIVGWVARNGMPVIANDVSKDDHFNKDIDEVSGVAAKSILAVPLGKGQRVIGVLEVINKADGGAFGEQDLSVLTGLASTEAFVLLVLMTATTLRNMEVHKAEPDWQETTIETLVTAADIEGPYVSGHSQRVRDYTLLAAKSLSFSQEELQIIEFGALLHDIGKIGIDDSILLNPGSLSEEEWSVIRKHPLIGANIVGEIPFLMKARGIVLSHHEWYDGSGYPEGLKGEDIPIGARLVAVADAFDTMTTEHFYRPALSVDEAMSELSRCAGTQFCPVVVEAFISALKKQEEELAKEEAERLAREQQKIEVGEGRKTKDVEDADAWRSKGITLLRAGKNEEALQTFEKAIELNPESAIAWRNKGTALGRLGRDEEALAVFVKAIELEPESVSAWHNKATALSKLGRHAEAKGAREVEKSLEKKAEIAARVGGETRDAGSAETWRDKGITLVREGRDEEALEAFLRAIALDPKYAVQRKKKVIDLLGFRRDKEVSKTEEAEDLEQERAKQEAREKAKREAEEAAKAREAEKEEKKRAKQEAREQAQREAEEEERRKEAEKMEKERAEQEAREQAQREAEEEERRKEAEKQAKEKAEQEAREQAQREAEEEERRQEAEKLERERAEQEAREQAQREAEEEERRKEAEKQAKEKAEQEAREQAQREAEEEERRKEAEKQAKEKAEQEAREQAQREAEEEKRRKEAEKKAREKAEQEAREQAKREAEEEKRRKEARKKAREKAVQEARERAKREAEEEKKAEREAREKAKREAEEAAKAREADKEEEKRAKQEAREKAKREAEEAEKAKEAVKAREAEEVVYSIGSELFEGDVRLEIQSSGGFEQVEQFKRSLSMVENLKVILDSWSEDEGILIVVSLQEPMPLGSILSQMPIVKQVYEDRKNIVVVLSD